MLMGLDLCMFMSIGGGSSSSGGFRRSQEGGGSEWQTDALYLTLGMKAAAIPLDFNAQTDDRMHVR